MPHPLILNIRRLGIQNNDADIPCIPENQGKLPPPRVSRFPDGQDDPFMESENQTPDMRGTSGKLCFEFERFSWQMKAALFKTRFRKGFAGSKKQQPCPPVIHINGRFDEQSGAGGLDISGKKSFTQARVLPSGRNRKSLKRYEDLPEHPDFVCARVFPGENLLANLVPGTGKEIRFFLPEEFRMGVCLVISPFRLLIRDMKVPTNLRFHYGEDEEPVFAEFLHGGLRLLYISPSHLVHPDFRSRLTDALEGNLIRYILVDEAQMVSFWHKDFSPFLLHIPELVFDLREVNPGLSLIGLTSEANPTVLVEIMRVLHIPDENRITPHSMLQEETSLQTILCQDGKTDIFRISRFIKNDLQKVFQEEDLQDILSAHRKDKPVYRIFPHGHPARIRDLLRQWTRQWKNFPSDQKDSGFSGLLHPEQNEAAQEHTGFLEKETAKEEISLSRFDLLFATKESLEKDRGIRLVIHTGLAPGIDQWIEEAGHAFTQNLRTHLVQLAELPSAACEMQMAGTPDLVPPCMDSLCPFGKSRLCDYGRILRRIGRTGTNVILHVISCLQVLDTLVEEKEKENAIRIRVPREDQNRYVHGLYALSVIGCVRDVHMETRDEKVLFSVTGFSGEGRKSTMENHIIGFLSRIGIFGDIAARNREDAFQELFPAKQNAEEMPDALRNAADRGKLKNYGTCIVLFREVSESLCFLFEKLFEARDLMERQKARNMVRLAMENRCRQAALLRRFTFVEENWTCGFCDLCKTDLAFDQKKRNFVQDHKRLEYLLPLFHGYFAQKDFDPDEAGAFLDCIKGCESTILSWTRTLLESDPYNIKALYILARLCRETEKEESITRCLFHAGRCMEYDAFRLLYEDLARRSSREKELFDILDDEYGALNCPEGELWLYKQAISLDMPEKRKDMLFARNLLQTFSHLDLDPHIHRLSGIVKEI